MPASTRRRAPKSISNIGSLIGASSSAYARSAAHLANTVSGRRAFAFHRAELPGASLWPLPTAHALLDEVIKVYFHVGREPFADVDVHTLRVELDEMVRLHEKASPHRTPDAPDSVSIQPRSFAGLRAEWMTFDSGWEPAGSAPGRDRWLEGESDGANSILHTGLLRHRDGADRPWLVLVHGAEMGRQRLDARIMKAQYFHETLGVNIAMPVLPRHGLRGPGTGHLRGSFPSDDLVGNIHGLVQAVWDVRRVLAWLRSQGADTIGMYGFSLGGNIVSQVAQYDDDLAAVVAGCPAVDLMDLVKSNMPAPVRRQHRELLTAGTEAGRVVTPLGLPSALPTDRMAVIGASHDRLADALQQAGRLWHHWGRPEMHMLSRGHVSIMMGQELTGVVEGALRQRGVAYNG